MFFYRWSYFFLWFPSGFFSNFDFLSFEVTDLLLCIYSAWRYLNSRICGLVSRHTFGEIFSHKFSSIIFSLHFLVFPLICMLHVCNCPTVLRYLVLFFSVFVLLFRGNISSYLFLHVVYLLLSILNMPFFFFFKFLFW